jgi:hypothetical protein
MRARLVPSMPELLFLAILVWLFTAGGGRSALLADGDTGWHIRNGEEILNCLCVPHTDSFAFGTEGLPWFAWEWLSDVGLAALNRFGGLTAVAVFSAIVIATVPALLFGYMLSRGAGMIMALPLTLLAAGASTVHFLARPHIVTLLLTPLSVWALDRDRRQAWGWIWGLPLLVALWTNLHGGFLVVFTLLAVRLGDSVFARPRIRAAVRRDILLTVACAAATLLNPYGWRLHVHVIEYLRSDWIRQVVEEFQSPRFRSESMLQFEILLVSGIAIVPILWSRRRLAEGCLILFWAHEALGSVRHVPIYCLVAAPLIAGQFEVLWSKWAALQPARSWAGLVRQMDVEWRQGLPGSSPAHAGFGLVPAAVCLALLAVSGTALWTTEFPAAAFPSALVSRNFRLLSTSDAAPVRVFSSDQWSDFLIYRLHPRVRIFVDGRSDFFGPSRGGEYARLMEGRPGCSAILEREKVRFALIPSTWPLAGLLAADPQWRQVDRDNQAILFRRRGF